MISEELLKQAAEETEQIMLESLPAEETTHDFSSEFEHKMQKMCKQTEQSRVYIFLKRAACAVLAIVLLCGALMLNTEARAAVVGWVRERYSDFNRYYIGKPEVLQQERKYELSWLPDGYTLTETNDFNDFSSVIYADTEGNLISFFYTTGNSAELFVGGDIGVLTQTSLHGMPVDVYVALDADHFNTAIWNNTDEGRLFSVVAKLDTDIILRILEGICPAEIR